MIESLVHKAETTMGSSFSIGIGIPGSPSPKTGLIKCEYTMFKWYGFSK